LLENIGETWRWIDVAQIYGLADNNLKWIDISLDRRRSLQKQFPTLQPDNARDIKRALLGLRPVTTNRYSDPTPLPDNQYIFKYKIHVQQDVDLDCLAACKCARDAVLIFNVEILSEQDNNNKVKNDVENKAVAEQYALAAEAREQLIVATTTWDDYTNYGNIMTVHVLKCVETPTRNKYIWLRSNGNHSTIYKSLEKSKKQHDELTYYKNLPDSLKLVAVNNCSRTDFMELADRMRAFVEVCRASGREYRRQQAHHKLVGDVVLVEVDQLFRKSNFGPPGSNLFLLPDPLFDYLRAISESRVFVTKITLLMYQYRIWCTGTLLRERIERQTCELTPWRYETIVMST
jgi:hypothetical protein